MYYNLCKSMTNVNNLSLCSLDKFDDKKKLWDFLLCSRMSGRQKLAF